MVFKTNKISLKRTNLLSRISCSKVCFRNMYRKIGPSVVVPKTPAVLARNAFFGLSTTPNNLSNGIFSSRQAQVNQMLSNLPPICKFLPQAGPLAQPIITPVLVSTTNLNNSSKNLNKPITIANSSSNNSSIPQAPTITRHINAPFKAQQGSVIINPLKYNVNPILVETFKIIAGPGVLPSLVGKIFVGSRILKDTQKSGMTLGRPLSRAPNFRNRKGNTEFNELLDSKNTIENYNAAQFGGGYIVVFDTCLVPISSLKFKKSIMYDLTQDVRFIAPNFNFFVNNNVLGAHYLNFGVLHSAFEKSIDLNKI